MNTADKRRSRLLELAQAEVAQTLAALPSELQSAARRLPVGYQPKPTRHQISGEIDADTLGVFVGPSMAYEETASGELAPHIILFLDNLWLEADGQEDLFREEVRVTFMHELGHYLGLDEDDLAERDLL